MFVIVDTVLSYERELIECSFLQDFSKGKGNSLQLICNAHTAFLLWRAGMVPLCSMLSNLFDFQCQSKSHLFMIKIGRYFLKKRSFPKFQLIPIFLLQIMHDYVLWHCSIDYCVKSMGKLLLFHPKMISAQFIFFYL